MGRTETPMDCAGVPPACGRLEHATFRERADASVRCTGLGVKLYMPMSDKALAGYLLSTDVRIIF